MKINELHDEGKTTLTCMIARADQGVTNKGVPYLTLALEDSTGTLDARWWNLNDEQVKAWKPGMIVQAEGDVIVHRHALQLRVRNLKLVEDASLMDFVRSAPDSAQSMEEEIRQAIDGMKNPVIRTLVNSLLEKKHDAFFSWPAAVKNHHNYPGGLAYHTLSMLRTAEFVSELYPFLDQDLLYAGIILHDMGKIHELSDPVLPEYTPAGNLIGHISMMVSELDREAVAEQVQDTEEVMLLKHMILSHHGKLEFGSPVLPMIPEAEVLTMLDNLDARMVMMKETLDSTIPGTMSPRVFALDNRMLYRRKDPEQKDRKTERKEEQAA